MAELTKMSPEETNSEQRFVQAAPATPSPLTSVFDFASNVVGVADKAWTKLDQNARVKAAGLDEAAKNDAVKRIASGLFSDPSMAPQPNVPPQSMGAYTNSKPLAAQAASTQTAATQGQIDPAMAQARSIAVFRQALAANPGHEFAVFQAFKEAGVQNMMMQQYDNAVEALKSDQADQRATIHKLQDDAVNKYGYTNFFQMSDQDQATTLAKVGQLNAEEQALDAKTKAADLSLKNVQLTDAQRTQMQKQTSSDLAQSFSTYLQGNIGNLQKVAINLLGDPDLAKQPGRLEQLQSHLMSVAIPSMDTLFYNKLASMGTSLTPEDRTFLTDQYTKQRQSFVDMISGPQSVVEMNKRVLTDITNSYGIQYEKAAPFLMNLQRMIGPQAVGVLTSPALLGNPKVKELITNDLNNVIRDPSKTASFTEFVQSLNGSVDPSTWDPEKMRSLAPAALAATAALAKDSASFNGSDKQGHLALVNSIKQTAGLAVDVVPQWGFGNVLSQGKALNTKGVTTALFNTGTTNASDKIEAVHSWIPATTRTYETLSQMNAGDQYYSVQMDPHTLQWKAVWNGKMVPNASSGSSGFGLAEAASPGTYGGMSKPAPSTKVLEQAATLNTMLNNLSQVGHGGFDDVLGKGVSYNDARRFYATGEVPQSLKASATSNQKNGKTPEQNVDDAISHMLDFVNKLPNPGSEQAHGKGPAPALENKASMDAYYAKNPSAQANYQKYSPVVASAAQAHGVPLGVAMNVIHTESKFNPNADSGDAHGLGQISYKTAAAKGWDLHNMTPEENLDHSMEILAENYKATGNWHDATAMYLTGRTIAKAGKAKDKNGTTAAMYAAATVPATLDPAGWLGTHMPEGVSTPYGTRY